MEFDHVIYEVDDRVGVITLNRPEAANAQTPKVLDELDAAWQEADRDPQVKVIVLKSNGKHFSAGHDMAGMSTGDIASVFSTAEGHYDWETRVYLGYAMKWRDVPKPTIAAVQGKCIAAGLMLCWPCDLIVAAENAEFSDPVLFMGMNGVELHAHAWEFGARKAKEILFTGGSITAADAERIGMVNQVVPLDDLVSTTMAMAHRIAKVDEWALRMAKRSINQTLDVQGYRTAIASAFDMHHLGHIRARIVTGGIPALVNLDAMKEKQK